MESFWAATTSLRGDGTFDEKEVMTHGELRVPDLFDRLAAELRPKLHRYCARMTGSVIDGEDVVQEALLKAIDAIRDMDSIAHPKAWLFRIAHNAAVDFLRRRSRRATQI